MFHRTKKSNDAHVQILLTVGHPYRNRFGILVVIRISPLPSPAIESVRTIIIGRRSFPVISLDTQVLFRQFGYLAATYVDIGNPASGKSFGSYFCA
jgi:hypothetical protein